MQRGGAKDLHRMVNRRHAGSQPLPQGVREDRGPAVCIQLLQVCPQPLLGNLEQASRPHATADTHGDDHVAGTASLALD